MTDHFLTFSHRLFAFMNILAHGYILFLFWSSNLNNYVVVNDDVKQLCIVLQDLRDITIL